MVTLDVIAAPPLLRKPGLVDAAELLEDLHVPPGNRSEKLKGIAPGNTVFASTISGASASGGRTATRAASRLSTARAP
jgi:hypothetical protein